MLYGLTLKSFCSGTLQNSLDQDQCVGRLCETTPVDIVHSGEAEDEIQARRDELPPVDSVVNVAQFESMAKHVLGEDSREWRYFSSYCDDGVSKLNDSSQVLA